MITTKSFVYVEQNGNSVGLFHTHKDARIMVKQILVGDIGLSEKKANQVIAKNLEDKYLIYYDEINLYEKSVNE